MDPITIITTTIGLIGTSIECYNVIKEIQGLPQAFKEVERQLPLVQKILTDVKQRLADPQAIDIDKTALQNLIVPCQDDAKTLKEIFEKMEQKCKEDRDGTKLWDKARVWYREALRGTKAHRVESLMKTILDRIQLLASKEIFNLHNDSVQIMEALNKLSKVDVSLEDSEMEVGAIHAQQTIQGHAKGTQYNVSGGTLYSGNNSGHTFGNVGTLTFVSCLDHNIQKDLPRQPGRKIEYQGRPKPTCYIPNGKNAKFTGRMKIMQKLQAIIRNKQSALVALFGLGGVGKSEIALNFAHWVKETLPNHSVLWISALSSSSIDKSYGDIARKLGLPNTSGPGVKLALREYMSSGDASPWLLIVDNADDEDILKSTLSDGDDNSILPQDNHCLTLFTTRSWDVAQRLSQGNVIEVEAMDEDDARRLLATLLENNVQTEPKQIDTPLLETYLPPTITHAAAYLYSNWKFMCDYVYANLLGEYPFAEPDPTVTLLLKKLTHLPLAISHAAAYMKRNGKSINDYVNLMESADEILIKLLQENMPIGKETTAVLTTWAISFDQISKHHSQAATLLSFCSQIEPKGIPRTMLPNFSDEIALDQAIGTLLGYAFIRDRGDMQQTFDMHGLVHLAAGVWLEETKGSKAAAEAAVIRLAELTPESEGIIEGWREYLPHACRLLMSMNMAEVNLSEKTLRVGLCVGRILFVDIRYRESAQIFERTLQLCERMWDEYEETMMSASRLLVKSLSNLGLSQRRQAVEIAELVYEQTNRSWWAHPADRIESELDLALAYLSADRKEEASDRADILVKKLRPIDAHDHDWVFVAKARLGELFLGNEKYSECIDMLEGALVLYHKMGHGDKMQPFEVQRQLATAYLGARQNDKAVELLERVVEEQTALGRDFPQMELLGSRQALGNAYMLNNQLSDAIRLFDDLLEIIGCTLGLAGQPLHLRVKSELATTYAMKDQWEDAIKLGQELEAAEKGFTKGRGVPEEEDEALLARQYFLAWLYLAGGRLTEGINLIKHVVEARRRILGEDHRLTISAQEMLAMGEEKERQG